MTEIEVLQNIYISINFFMGIIAGVLIGFIFWNVIKETHDD